MTALNSPVSSFLFAHNSRVRAWCSTSFYQSGTLTQAAFDATNFLDGFNLRMDVATQQLSGDLQYSGALRFSFINPLPDNQYKVFVQPFFQPGSTILGAPFVAHVLNSVAYPKTKQSFWVRLGFMVRPVNTTATGLVTNKPATLRLRPGAPGDDGKIKVVVL
jgi:hypothetical protein